jgi:D-psicose/D-tagatose/L-ribulose 3-epimerase
MTLAACEWIFASDDLPAVLARLADAGCDGIELTGEPGRTGVRAALADAGVAATGITAVCMAPTDQRDLAHPDPAARRRAVGYYRGNVELAAETGAPAIGLIPAAVGRVDGDSDAWERAVEGAREVAEYAGQVGVRVAVEAVNRYETFLVNRAEQALAFADAIGGDVVLDAFHMQLEEADSAQAVIAAAPRLAALHLADSNRLGLGRGQLDVAPVIRAARAAGYRGPLVFEFTAPGPNPFRADKGDTAMAALDDFLRESVPLIRDIDEGDRT